METKNKLSSKPTSKNIALFAIIYTIYFIGKEIGHWIGINIKN